MSSGASTRALPGRAPSPPYRLINKEDPRGRREKAGPGNRSIRSSIPCQTASLRGRKHNMATLLWILLIVCSVVASPHQLAAQSTVKISGSNTGNLNVFQNFKAQIETASGIKLE